MVAAASGLAAVRVVFGGHALPRSLFGLCAFRLDFTPDGVKPDRVSGWVLSPIILYPFRDLHLHRDHAPISA